MTVPAGRRGGLVGEGASRISLSLRMRVMGDSALRKTPPVKRGCFIFGVENGKQEPVLRNEVRG